MRDTTVTYKDGVEWPPQDEATFEVDTVKLALWHLIEVARKEAPPTVGGCIVIVSIYRKPAKGARFSYHHVGRAVDLRTDLSITPEGMIRAGGREGAIVDPDEVGGALTEARDWAQRIRERLGNEYDVVWNQADHLSHLHLEFDRRKEEKCFGDESL